MKHSKLLLAASVIALGLSPTFAHAAGTAANSKITLSATVDYTVGGVTSSNSAPNLEVVVDLKASMTFSGPADNVISGITPSKTRGMRITFVNTSNDTLDFKLTAAYAGTDTDANAPIIYVDDGDRIFEPDADDKVHDYFDDVPPDGERIVWLAVKTPLRFNANLPYQMTAKPYKAGASNAFSNEALVQTTGANTDGMDVVFAEPSYGEDPANDGALIEQFTFSTLTSIFDNMRYTKVISDPVNGTNSPSLIPGAVINFCYGKRNKTTGRYTDFKITHAVPDQITLDESYGVHLGYYDSNFSSCVKLPTTGTITPADPVARTPMTISVTDPAVGSALEDDDHAVIMFRGTLK